MAAKMAAKMKLLKTFSMQYAHLSVDIQLYHVACIVQWSDSYCRTSLVLHPAMMHTLMSFLGCIGTLMKASCVDMLLIVAFGGVADIITGKWTNALPYYVHAIPLRQFCSRISSRVAPIRTRSCASTRMQSESTRLRGSGWTA